MAIAGPLNTCTSAVYTGAATAPPAPPVAAEAALMRISFGGRRRVHVLRGGIVPVVYGLLAFCFLCFSSTLRLVCDHDGLSFGDDTP